AAPRPAPGRWERRAPRPPSRSRPARADADALRAEMIGAAATLARPVEPRLRQERPGSRGPRVPACPARGAADASGGRGASRPGLFRPFGLGCGRPCVDAFIQPSAGAFVVALAARRPLVLPPPAVRGAVAIRRRRTGRADLAALPRWAGGFLGRAVAGAKARG